MSRKPRLFTESAKMSSSKLPSSAGSEGQDPHYQCLSAIQTSMDMTSAEYEYPLSLDNTPPPCPSPDHEDQPGGSQSEQPIYENVASSNGQLPPIADDSDIDSDYSEVEQALIQVYLYVVLYNFVCIYMYGCFTSVMYLIS